VSGTWLSFLTSNFDKHERLRALERIAPHLRERDFWPLFAATWQHNESLHQDADTIRSLLTDWRFRPLRGLMMTRTERRQLAFMPDPITVYRGCWEGNRSGFSWTLSRTTVNPRRARGADWFARRCAVDGKPLVLHGVVAKADVIAYLTGYGEREIVAEPERVAITRVDRLKEQPVRPSARLFQAIQAGTLLTGTDAATVEMQIYACMLNRLPLERFIDLTNQTIAELERYGFTEKADFHRHRIAVAHRVYAGKGVWGSGRRAETA
jgi:hypothetical protein